MRVLGIWNDTNEQAVFKQICILLGTRLQDNSLGHCPYVGGVGQERKASRRETGRGERGQEREDRNTKAAAEYIAQCKVCAIITAM